MGTINDISQKLLSGYTTDQLVKEGYAKSSVNHAARKLKKTQPTSTPSASVDDEIAELRRQKEIVKLRKEIAELEAASEKIPDRLTSIEKTVLKLRSLMVNAVDTALYVSLQYTGMDQEEAKEYTDGWVGRNIKG